MDMKKLIYVCSPFTTKEAFLKKARACCREVIRRGHIPIAPQLLYPQFLRSDKKEELDLGIDCGLTLLTICDELWVFGKDTTTDMENAITWARSNKIFVRHRDYPGRNHERSIHMVDKRNTGTGGNCKKGGGKGKRTS